jgi:hypothetical protein
MIENNILKRKRAMLIRSLRPFRAFAVAVAAFVTLAAGGIAQAACYEPQQQLPAQAIAQFTGNPADLLAKYPNGGAEMISLIRDLAASDPATLPLILSLVGNADPAQVDGIGTGLGQSALVCVRTDQAYATEIQLAVTGINSPALTLAFAAVLGDKPIGAVGGGGGGGGSGGQISPISGIGTLGGNSSIENLQGTSKTNTGFNFFTSSFSISSPGTSTTTTTKSVSPTK